MHVWFQLMELRLPPSQTFIVALSWTLWVSRLVTEFLNKPSKHWEVQMDASALLQNVLNIRIE